MWNTKDNFAKIPQIAEENYGFEVWGLRGMIHDLMQQRVTSGSRDDILRTLELVSLVEHEEKAFLKKQIMRKAKMRTNLKMECPKCGHWNRIEVNKVFLEQKTSESKVKAMTTPSKATYTLS